MESLGLAPYLLSKKIALGGSWKTYGLGGVPVSSSRLAEGAARGNGKRAARLRRG